MAAPRATSFKALRNLQRVSHSVPPGSRGLRVTNVQASPSRFDLQHKTSYMPWGLQELRNECRKRKLNASGTKPELIDQLAAHDSMQARAFSMALRRIAKDQTKKPVSSPADDRPQRREFNTSRALKANNDSSTIDFAYLPKLFQEEWEPTPAAIRVPILPHVESEAAEATLEKFPELDAAAGGYQDTDAGVTMMKPQISAADPSIVLNFSVLSDVQDGSPREMSLDVLSRLSDSARQMTVAALVGGSEAGETSSSSSSSSRTGTEASTIRQVWSGFVDDLFGAQHPTSRV